MEKYDDIVVILPKVLDVTRRNYPVMCGLIKVFCRPKYYHKLRLSLMLKVYKLLRLPFYIVIFTQFKNIAILHKKNNTN